MFRKHHSFTLIFITMMRIRFLLAFVLCVAFCAMAGIRELPNGQIELTGSQYKAYLDASHKQLRVMTADGKGPATIRTMQLWFARFRDGKEEVCSNAQFLSHKISGETLTLDYHGQRVDVSITITAGRDTLDFQGTTHVLSGDMTEFCVPGVYEFPVADGGSLIMHQRGPANVGIKLKAPFFRQRTIWTISNAGNEPFKTLFGDKQPLSFPQAARSVTAVGRDLWSFISEAQFKQITSYKDLHTVPLYIKAPMPPGSMDLELLKDPTNGNIALGANRLGSSDGALFRLGGIAQGEMIYHINIQLYGMIARNHTTRERNSIVILGGVDGFRPPFTSSIGTWLTLLNDINVTPKVVKTAQELVNAMNDPHTAAIINPYGDHCMTPIDCTMMEFVEKIRQFVRGGGYWMEFNALHSFQKQIQQKPGYLPLGYSGVPYSFADLFITNTGRASFALYSVQPATWEPFAALQDKRCIFIPSMSYLFSRQDGGKLDRRFITYIRAGEQWTCPVTRVRFGVNEFQAADAFCRDNDYDHPLRERYDAAFLQKFLRRPFISSGDFHNDTYQKEIYKLNVMPEGLFHICFYTHADFDHMYPDILPPLPRWGTLQDFENLYRITREKGSFLLPYTNNTFWCDLPPGPTFVKAGKAPLQVDMNGKNVWEMWNGWATCMWHPAVRAANDKLCDTFTKTYPTEILFQDQVAARGVSLTPDRYDFNPASPTPYARVEGFISQARKDARRAGRDTALATEDMGSMFMCHYILGAGNNIVEPALLEWIPGDAWELYNFIGLLSHDKTEMFFHGEQRIDTNYKLAKALGLGFGMLGVISSCDNGPELSYLHWIAAIQQRIVARHVGEKMTAFHHQWAKPGTMGIIRATYGPMKVFANLQDTPHRYNDLLTLDKESYYVESSDGKTKLGYTTRVGTFVHKNGFLLDGNTLILFAMPGKKAAFPAPAGLKAVRITDASLPFNVAKSAGFQQKFPNGLPLEIANGAAVVTLPDLRHEDWEHPWTLEMEF